MFDFGFYVAQAATQVGFHVYAVTLRFADDGDDFVCIRMIAIMLFVHLTCACCECCFKLIAILRFVYSRYDFRGARQCALRMGDAFEHGLAMLFLLFHRFPQFQRILRIFRCWRGSVGSVV